MEKFKCKLCFKLFSNGRALGGHMRSHMASLPVLTNHEQTDDDDDSASSCEEKGLSYLLRENPKKSFRLVDPEFNSAVDSCSAVVQDRESETDQYPTRRRSKRNRNSVFEYSKSCLTDSLMDTEPVSSISDATTEEDVAFCLMMLSRDKSRNRFEQESEKSIEETDECSKTLRNRVKFKCETCDKVFQSYQALGGHRASHKKLKIATPNRESESVSQNADSKQRIHQCPVCYRVFASGQALGGHKRSHLTNSSPAPANNLIDLNLPAPIDDADDDITPFELSAISNGELIPKSRFEGTQFC